MAVMIAHVGKQRGNKKCTVKEEVEGERYVGREHDWECWEGKDS